MAKAPIRKPRKKVCLFCQYSASHPGLAPEPGACLTAAYSTVDNFAGNVDGEAAESFFHAQAMDGISAGSRGGGR
jgi:hypothetical protein